jgi:CHAT domain-containing protein
MRISAFAMHLQQAQVQFVYLSCCESARVGNSGRLVDNNLLGIADDIIHRGTPAVLGHRWLVPGQSAKELALVFYLSLAQTGQLDTALYHARRRLYGQNPADITWLSPVLAMQS